MKNVIITIACTLFTLTIVQANQHNQVDSLSNKNYRYFEEKVMEFRKDTIKAVKITKYWLNIKQRKQPQSADQSIPINDASGGQKIPPYLCR